MKRVFVAGSGVAILMALTVTGASTSVGTTQAYVPPEIIPATGNACEIDTDPIGDNPRAPSLSIRHEVGGDADPSDDSRTIWLKPGSEETDLELIGSGSTLTMQSGISVLEVKGFTQDPSVDTVHAVLTDSAGSHPIDLSRSKGDWSIGGFTILVQPKADETISVLMLDTDTSAGSPGTDFLVPIEIQSHGPTGGNPLSKDVQIILDPSGGNSIVPEMDVSYYFDGGKDAPGNTSNDFYVKITPRKDGKIGGAIVKASTEYTLEFVNLTDHSVDPTTGTASTSVSFKLSQGGGPLLAMKITQAIGDGGFPSPPSDPSVTAPTPYFSAVAGGTDQLWLWLQDLERAGASLLVAP